MTASQNIRQNISFPQTKDKLVEMDGIPTDTSQRWFSQIQVNLNDVIQRGDDGLLLNPDFNWCRTNGTTPTTQADGDDYSFIEQWAVFGATGNNYTITPTAYPSDSANPSGSKYFSNFNISTLANEFYIYNINYNGNFNQAQKFQSNTSALSMQLTNHGDNSLFMRFGVKIQGITDEIMGKRLTIQPGKGKYFTTIAIPALKGSTAASNAYAQFRLHVEPIPADKTANFDLNYVKSEIASLATNINVNHIAQKLLIDGL